MLIDQARLIRNDTNMIIDLDSMHSYTFGVQEQTDYNTHYQTNGYHALVTFNGSNGDLLKAKLRSGNQYTSKGVKKFLEPLLKHYEVALPVTDILVRGDSGFATPDIYELCEEYNQHLVIRLKNNKKLYHPAEETACFDKKWKGLQINIIRLRLFIVAGILINTSRQVYLKLSSAHVY